MDQPISFRMGPNNNSTVSYRILNSDFLVDFSNNQVYEMPDYALFAPLGQVSTEVMNLDPRRTIILLGANTQVNATAPQTYQF